MKQRNPTKVDNYFGARIRMRRMEQQISQTDLGEKLGVSFQQVQKYEKGANRVSAGRLMEIAAALEVPISYFYDAAPGPALRSDAATDIAAAFCTSHYGVKIMAPFQRLPADLQKVICDLVAGMADGQTVATKAPQRRAA